MSSALLLLIVAVVTGVFCGSVGVGGILMIPSLMLLGGMTVHEAVGTALFAFVFFGMQGAWLYARRGSVDWALTVPVCAGSFFFGMVGAWLNSIIDARPLAIAIALLVMVAGLNILRPATRNAAARRDARSRAARWELLGVGAVSGVGSGLTGAGGPIFSVPLMLLRGFPVLPTIATGQVLVVVASASATLGNLAYGSIDYWTALWIIPALFLGMWIGVELAHRVRVDQLKALVAAFCIILGAAMLYGAY